ncbi:5-dehydro-4-deoxy-D-glucuronate isomerase [Parahaliea aestuarii]|uniref:4-deoxy-L-threo-5-hexosulose-uronate ketol-isomerase n=1 Tax=Parahaliea aestuarii TaxID=1852021 RepID=A0A5C8ZT95_9GAMM|nr:5-dehydro-4-deoxy-D-glucuronate isomerase [Parahaliea aestuarii]TXS91728.1 5-dehydro-4-deoxy-D-glucuronate isomerase [Parahaliea aestuarii]
MTTEYSVRFATHPDDYKRYDTETLRKHYHVSNLFQQDRVSLTYTHYERLIVGGVFPVTRALPLETIDPLKAEYFLHRRELGAINIGGPGTITVDGTVHEIGYREAMYLGAGNKQVEFASVDSGKPAKFYINSAPAHHSYPDRKVGMADADAMTLGSGETCNERTINKLLVNTVVETCQLQMGLTEFHPGSVWNTMPAHIHDRRMEAYFYFELPEDQAVCHFMGPKEETRHIWMGNEEAVVSPPWSMHTGVGTSSYVFIWGMAGENLDYGDMDHCQPHELR